MILRIRPHHLLCLRFFAGHGYSMDFTDNVRSLISRMREEDARIHLVQGCDEVCIPCPHRIGDVCRYARSVSAKDDSVSRFLGLSRESEASASTLMSLVDERLADLSDVRDVCGECEWSSLCDRQLEKARSRLR